MRQQFVECETREQAQDTCPWASVIIEVTGGWQCFESIADAETWQNQV